MSALSHDLRSRISKNIAPIGISGEYAYSSPQALMVPETVDEREMSAEFVIVSKVEDREYDVITPQGCEEYLDEYRRNPVVLLEHDALKPIGLSTDKAGVFHFRVLTDRIIAKCFFHCLPLNGENLSEEVFRLVTKGVFRGASPGFLPIRGRKRGYGKDDGYEYHAWRLTEWSITTQPVNQLALKMSLGGVRCKSLKRTLESLVLPKAKSSSATSGFKPYGNAGLDSVVTAKNWKVPAGAKSMKPKTASIEFDKSIFTHEKAAAAWLDLHGYDSSSCAPLPTSYIFKQRDGHPGGGQKSLARGVTALLLKSFDESKHPRDGGKFASTAHSASKKTTTAGTKSDHHEASSAALSATKRADKTGDKGHHEAAEKAHRHAAALHQSAADRLKGSSSSDAAHREHQHRQAASAHSEAATHHSHASGGGAAAAQKKWYEDRAKQGKSLKDDDDEGDNMKDEEKPDLEDEKVEKADDNPDDEEDDDDDVEDGDTEDDETGDEGEEAAEGEDTAENTTEYDPAALKKEADNLVDMIAHFEIACEHAERMKSESVKSPELFDKLHADATALVADLRAAYKDGFADQAMESAIEERKAGAAEKEETPVDATTGDGDQYKETMKALKAIESGLKTAKTTAKSLPRLAVA